MKTTAWELSAVLLLMGCGGGSTAKATPNGGESGSAGEAAADASWVDVLDRMNEAGESTSAFSLNFVGRFEGEEFVTGMWLSAVVWDEVSLNACDDVSVLASDPNTASGPRWFLQLETSATAPGIYPIVPSIDLLSEGLQAAVFLKQALGKNELVRRTALAGSIEVTSAPQSEGEWHEGKRMTGRLVAEFPEVAAREGRCSVSAAVNEAPPPPTCECALSDGTVFTCQRTGAYSCCHDLAAERRSFDVVFESRQCARMCVGTSLTTQRCVALND